MAWRRSGSPRAVALIPLAYVRSIAFVKPYVQGWWEFGKSSASFADLVIERS